MNETCNLIDSWELISTDNSESVKSISFTTNGRCIHCNTVWKNCNLLNKSAQTSQLIGKARELQLTICYSPRSYQSMTSQSLLTYTRMSSVFELNWTFIYPLSSCATSVHSNLYRKHISPVTDSVLTSDIEHKLIQENAWSQSFSAYSNLDYDEKASEYCLLPVYTSYLIPPFTLTSFQFSVLKTYSQNNESYLMPSLSKDSTHLPNESTMLNLLTGKEIFCSPMKHLFDENNSFGLLPAVKNDSNDLKYNYIPNEYLFKSSKRKEDPNILKYIKTQANKLDICGFYPANLFPVYIKVPQYVKTLLQLPVHLRFVTLCKSKQLIRSKEPFARIIKSTSMSKPLYVESSPLNEIHISSLTVDKNDNHKSNNSEKMETNSLRLGTLESPVLEPQKFVLLVCFSGKDMIGLDWLPFISRYLNYYICRQNECSMFEKHCDKKPRNLRPLVEIPKNLFKLIDKHSPNSYDTSNPQCSIASFDINYLKPPQTYIIRTATLLIDYPGYGKSIGKPNTLSITDSAIQSIKNAIYVLSKNYPSSLSQLDIHFLGYSLGAAVALNVACNIIEDLCIAERQRASMSSFHLGPLLQCGDFDYPLKRIELNKIILIAPFTSVSEWATAYIGIPFGFRPLLKSVLRSFTEPDVNWDNLSSIKRLYKLLDLHPFWMGERIANEAFRLRYANSKNVFGGKFKKWNGSI